jgi:hypothetical protein
MFVFSSALDELYTNFERGVVSPMLTQKESVWTEIGT